jgi:hypothetical protein
MTTSSKKNSVPPTNEPTNAERRHFLQNAAAAGLVGAATAKSVLGQSTNTPQQAENSTSSDLRERMLANIEPDVKADLEGRQQAQEELPEPAGLRPGGMLDCRFPVSYRTAVPNAIQLLTQYFAAFSDRDMGGVAATLHFPYATYEGYEPLVYQTGQDFINNPPPSIRESSKPDSQFRPGSYDMLDVLQVQTFNPVNVGLELCYTRYRADGFRIGINQGIYAVTNNDGKWGIQLSSVIFTPTEYIGESHLGATEAHLRQGRTGMAAFGDHDYDMLANFGRRAERSTRKIASIAGPPGATSFFLSAWAGKPMQPYDSKGRKTRLVVYGPGTLNSNPYSALAQGDTHIDELDRSIMPSNIVTKNGKPGWFYAMAGSGVGEYSYTRTLASSRVIHAGPEKAHAVGGYIRYTPDNIFISETRSLEIMIYDKHQGRWASGGMLGQSMYRDRTNDARASEA